MIIEDHQRTCEIERRTKEVNIVTKINLDGKGNSNVNTGIDFLNHIVVSFSKHSKIDIDLKAKSEDGIKHHLIEDTGIVLGHAIDRALGKRENINRFGNATIPMDESLSSVAVDLIKRQYSLIDMKLERDYVEIAAGDSITWYNGVDVPNPHTVTFVRDLDNIEKIGVPFYVSNNTQIIPVFNNLGEPLEETTSNGTRVVMMLNARALTPTVITANNSVMDLKKDSIYAFNGSEKFVNSGPLLSLDKEQKFDYSFSSSFTVVFNKPGFFEYTCLFHPWMIGKLVVKP